MERIIRGYEEGWGEKDLPAVLAGTERRRAALAGIRGARQVTIAGATAQAAGLLELAGEVGLAGEQRGALAGFADFVAAH